MTFLLIIMVKPEVIFFCFNYQNMRLGGCVYKVREIKDEQMLRRKIKNLLSWIFGVWLANGKRQLTRIMKAHAH